MRADEGAGPAAAVLSRVEQAIGHVLDHRAHANFFPIVSDDCLGLLMVAPLRGAAELELHALALAVNEHAVAAGFPARFGEQFLRPLQVMLINRR